MSDLDALVAAYSLTPDDKQKLTTLLAKAYLLAKARAYRAAVERTAHLVQLKAPWTPGQEDADKARAWAAEQVESIAATYAELLRNALERELSEERAFGSLAGKIKQVATAVGDWFRGFLPWKSQQIANATVSQGSHDGTVKWVEDATGDDAEWVEGVSPDDGRVQVQVLPESSSSDGCAEIAGQVYNLNDDLPDVPLHNNCVHYLEVITS